MNVAYEPVKRRLLREYPWGFAIKRASVAALVAETTWGGLKQYPLPNDFLRLILEDDSDHTADASYAVQKDWKIEGENIVTGDGSPLQFRYVADIDDTTKFDALFDEALVALLAFETCEELTQSNEKKSALWDEMRTAIRLARATGAIEKGALTQVQDPWLDAML